jgi:hypothetical protein
VRENPAEPSFSSAAQVSRSSEADFPPLLAMTQSSFHTQDKEFDCPKKAKRLSMIPSAMLKDTEASACKQRRFAGKVIDANAFSVMDSAPA